MAGEPVILWQNIITATGITASAEETGYPVTSLANGLTYDRYRAPVTGDSSGLTYIYIDAGAVVSCDAFGIAAHNLGTIGATITVYGSDTAGIDSSSVQLGTETPTTDAPLLSLGTSISHRYWIVEINPGTVTSTSSIDIGVLYIGASTRFERCLRAPFAPGPLNRRTDFYTNTSMNGQFTGRSIIRRGFQGSVSIQNMTATWARTTFQDFVRAARTAPYFFAWNPDDYPTEVLFADTSEDIGASYTGDRDRMSAEWSMTGLGWDD